MKYKLEANGVKNNETGAIIPNSTENRDWVEYLAWVADGNTPDAEFTAEEIEAKRILTIKATAGSKIVEIMPEWRQRNNLARMLEIISTAVDLTKLSALDLDEIAAAQIQWNDVKVIRTKSNDAEKDGTAADKINW